MSEKFAKSFKLPKIKKQESKDNLRQVDVNSRDCQELISVVKRSFLSSNYSSKWQVKSASFVDNKKLESSYRAKKSEMKEGRHSRDLVDQYAFLNIRESNRVALIVKSGIRIGATKQNYLGDYKMGVYLWRNADIQLKLSESWSMSECTLMIFKVVLGKCKSLTGGEENIEPTPNFDCHIPQVPARPSDSFYQQVTRSQIYLYEYNDDCEPATYPRQCLPYAILVYEKTNIIPRSLHLPTDSYSKRPSSVRNNDLDTKTNKLTSDPKQRLYSDGKSSVSDDKTSDMNNLDPSDPRSQLSFLTNASTAKFEGYKYQPSFGPDDRWEPTPEVDNKEVDMDIDDDPSPDEPLSSLPPIALPIIPEDTRLLRAESIPSDPRMFYNDPRLRAADNVESSRSFASTTSDPRLGSKQTSFDPRLNRSANLSSDPRLADPRLARVPSDPRLQKTSNESMTKFMSSDPMPQPPMPHPSLLPAPSDPRLRQQQYGGTNLNSSSVAPRGQKGQVSGNDSAKSNENKTKKKLTLSDYKKKVNIAKPDTSASAKKEEVSKELESSASRLEENIYAKSQVSNEPSQQAQVNVETIEPEVYTPSVPSEPSLPPSTSDPFIPNEADMANDNFWSDTDDLDLRIKPATNTITYPSVDDQQEEDEDIVEEPSDMAKTLNELSDPDDVSQSPKTVEEVSVIEPPATNDPMLAEAMQKLVEHSGDVTLFTEALKDLQDSAEEFGEKLTDPEFLVKKIAEKIEVLLEAKKAESEAATHIVIDDDDDDESDDDDDGDGGIESPDMIMSPEHGTFEEEPVKEIPLENVHTEEQFKENENDFIQVVDMDISPIKPDYDERSESNLDDVMKKTLFELEKVEQQQNTQEARSENNVLETSKVMNTVDKNNVMDINVAEIPMPIDIPKPAEPLPLLQKKARSKFKTFNIPTEGDSLDEEDDDLRVTHVLPSFNEKQKKKPMISFNLKGKNKNKPENKSGIPKKDIDLRDTKKNVDSVNDEDLRVTKDKLSPSKTSKSESRKSVPYTSQKTDITSNVKWSNVSDRKDMNEDNKLDDEDMRNIQLDVDLRAESSQSSVSDYDMRKSHSRSVSPSPVITNTDKNVKPLNIKPLIDKTSVREVKSPSNNDDVKEVVPPITRFHDPFGLDEEFLPPRTLQSKSMEAKHVKEADPSSQGLFDAYDVGNKTLSENINEFGDIDWRQAAASEMGDVDFRSGQSENTNSESDAIKPPNAKSIKLSDNTSEPFVQLNKNIQNVFNPPTVSQQTPSEQYSDNIGVGEKTQSLYDHSKVQDLPAYKTSKQENVSASYEQSAWQPQNSSEISFQSLMQKVDFSNLKNILATVQQPAPVVDTGPEVDTGHVVDTGPVVDTGYTEKRTESDMELDNSIEENKSAFVSGQSYLTSTRPNSQNLEQTPKSSRDSYHTTSNQHRFDDTIPEHHRVQIPGFDISPETSSYSINEQKNDTNMSRNKLTDKSKLDSSPLKYDEEQKNSSKSSKDISKSYMSPKTPHKSDIPSTPKDSIMRDIEEEMTPLPNLSYQAAILESIEQSALKVRHDDTVMSDVDSPLILRKKSNNIDNKDEKDERKVKDKMDTSENDMKPDEDKNLSIVIDSDDDDDEVAGLVIDLSSPTSKTPRDDQNTPTLDERPEGSADDLIQEIDNFMKGEKDNEENVSDDKQQASEEMSTTDVGKQKENLSTFDLDHGESIQAKTKDEMTDLIEQSRKNIVIKLKGDTKRVNLKTGKTYSDMPEGSAIEVIGKTSTVQSTASQMIHPIHGIVSSTGNSPILSGSPSKMTNTSNHSTNNTKKDVNHISQITSVISGAKRPPSPFMGGNRVQPQLAQGALEFIHPVTGTMVQYGQQTYPSVPVLGQPIIAAPPQGNIYPIRPQPLVIPPTQPPVPSVPMMSQPLLSPVPPPPNVIMPHPVLPSPVFQNVPNQVRSPHATALHVHQDMSVRGQVSPLPRLSQDQHSITSPLQSPAAVTESKSDVFDCFKDKFEARVKDNQRVNPKSESSSFDGGDRNKTKSYNSNNVLVKIDTSDSGSKKRSSNEPIPEQSKRPKFSPDVKHSDFGSRILESFAEVKNESPDRLKQKSEKGKPPVKCLEKEMKNFKVEVKDSANKGTDGKFTDGKNTDGKSVLMLKSADISDGELEDGEISDDSMNSEEITINVTTDKRYVQHKDMRPYTINPSLTRSTYNTIQTVGNQFIESPKRIVNVCNRYPQPIPTIGHGYNTNNNNSKSVGRNVGADWADIIKNPEVKSVETVKGSNLKPSIPGSSTSTDDAASIVSKSAASISKTRQKSRAQCQVKTLGEWLKLELEIDNIEPLQKIIPYALNTDLTKIPKQRKRRIRMKVKNAIEQEGTRTFGTSTCEVTVSLSDDEEEIPKPINPNYAPEVTTDQTSSELKILTQALDQLRKRLQEQHGPGFNPQNTIPPSSTSRDDMRTIGAMTHVQTEMNLHLSRACYFGYPHRRVPDELLLPSELGGFKSEEEDVFLILMIPLSIKPYHKLLDEKRFIIRLKDRKKSTKDPEDLEEIKNNLQKHHKQRQAVLRGFTGYLNKKRLQKLQDSVNKYTTVYDYFKCVQKPPVHDSMLKFVRTTQMDLRQHLILAKQYLAMNEQKQKI